MANAPTDRAIEDGIERTYFVGCQPLHRHVQRRRVPVAFKTQATAPDHSPRARRESTYRCEKRLVRVRPALTEVIGERGPIQIGGYTRAVEQRLWRRGEVHAGTSFYVEQWVRAHRIARHQGDATRAVNDGK